MREYLLQRTVNLLGRDLAIRLGRHWNSLRSYIKYEDYHFFQQVAIETAEECNRTCWYCPNSVVSHRSRKMSWDTFHKALDRLVELEWNGSVSFGLYNEPLIDPNIYDQIRIAKLRLPKALIRLFSNGDFLTGVVADKLIRAGMFRCCITMHKPHPDKQQIDMIRGIARCRPRYFTLNPDGVTRPNNRGGLIKGIPANTGPCHTPERTLVISITGDVILCCNDYNRRHTFGNIHDKSLVEIWNNFSFLLVRKELREGIRALDICKQCKCAE